jgi:hypothetical protein
MGQLAIVNAPSSFTFIWSAIKPWLSKETAEKVEILGSDYREVLLELVDADNLPRMLGGNCTCGEEEDGADGCSLSFAGPWKEARMANGQREKYEEGKGVEGVQVEVKTGNSSLWEGEGIANIVESA